MNYNFDHYCDSDMPRSFTMAFDLRYTSSRSRCFKYMDNYFNPEYIMKYKRKMLLQPITYYWPDYSKVVWTKGEDGCWVSQVIVKQVKNAPANHSMKLGIEIKEKWIIENNQIKDVIEV